MKSFWNKTTISILVCVILLPISNILINYYFHIADLGITNSITLLAVFITILSTFYSNYKSDERVNKQIKTSKKQFEEQLKQNEKNLKEELVFNKKQEIYIKLYKDLNEFWELLDYERVKFESDTALPSEAKQLLCYRDFSKIYRIIHSFYTSPDFLYMPFEIRKIILNFLEYKNSNIKDYWSYYEEIINAEKYYNATKILSEIYPLLKQEMGLKFPSP